MTEQYPFFREADERTQAVIGEEAIVSDLSGTYQKPYAVLTQKRIYCKNERGNFITEADQVLGAGKNQNGAALTFPLWISFALELFGVLIKVFPWVQAINGFSEMTGISFKELLSSRDMWGLFDTNFHHLQLYVEEFFPTVIFCVIGAVCLLLFLLAQVKQSKAAPILLLIHPVWNLLMNTRLTFRSLILTMLFTIIPILLIVIYYAIGGSKNGGDWFEIRHSTGTFTFSPKQYPAGELKNFEAKVKALKAGVASGK